MFIILCLVSIEVVAQIKTTDVQLKMDEAKARLEEFNTEHKMDSLDQEKLPRIVSGGLFLGVNTSNFIITRDQIGREHV